MLQAKTTNLNNLKLVNTTNNMDENSWVTVKAIHNTTDNIDMYKEVCSEYSVSKKWVLLINPECESLESALPTFSHNNNILRVHTNNGKINIDNIAKALLKGHCSAIVLCDISLNKNDMARIKACANMGETQCIISTQKEILH